MTEANWLMNDKMKSKNSGASASQVEGLNVSPHGSWLLDSAREFFLAHNHFPWFHMATISQLFRAELHHKDHLSWPELEIDLEFRSNRKDGKGSINRQRFFHTAAAMA